MGNCYSTKKPWIKAWISVYGYILRIGFLKPRPTSSLTVAINEFIKDVLRIKKLEFLKRIIKFRIKRENNPNRG